MKAKNLSILFQQIRMKSLGCLEKKNDTNLFCSNATKISEYASSDDVDVCAINIWTI